MEIKSLKSTIL